MPGQVLVAEGSVVSATKSLIVGESRLTCDGKLVVFECGVDRAQWKNFGRQLRTMRSSFSTTEPLSS